MIQAEDYLTQHDTEDKLELFVQVFGAQTGLITLDQLSLSLLQHRAVHSAYRFTEHAGGPAVSGQPRCFCRKIWVSSVFPNLTTV